MSVITVLIKSLTIISASFSDCLIVSKSSPGASVTSPPSKLSLYLILRSRYMIIILGILHHLTVHHDESLVQVWIIDWQLLPGIAVAEFVQVEEEGGEDDTWGEERESDEKKKSQRLKQNPRNQITECADCDV